MRFIVQVPDETPYTGALMGDVKKYVSSWMGDTDRRSRRIQSTSPMWWSWMSLTARSHRSRERQRKTN